MHTLLRQPCRRKITRTLRMPCFRECDCAEVIYTVYRVEGEGIGNIPCQTGKGGNEEEEKRIKWLGSLERSG